jgi:N-acyl-D-aspartate/D-glutamate deacylase
MGLEAMKVRGRMQTGMVADITIFDPEKVTDKATYKAGEQGLPTAGIPYVIVNGQPVVKNGQFQKVWAGQPIRFPVEGKGRSEPASVEKWVKDFSVNTIAVDDSPVNPNTPAATKGGE